MTKGQPDLDWNKTDQQVITACVRLRPDDQIKMLDHAVNLCRRHKTLRRAGSARFWLRSVTIVKVSTSR